MEKRSYSLCQRLLAMLLCAVMLVPSALVPALAAEVTEPAATASTETVQAQADVSEEAEAEWILPDCDCGSTETELGKHEETCARKVFLEKFCEETAAEIYAKWEQLPEACRNYVLEYLGKDEANAEKLAELKGYIDAATQTASEDTGETTSETEGTTQGTEGTTDETEGTTEETEPEGAVFAINRNGGNDDTTVWSADVESESGLKLGKKVEATADPDKFILTLDAYATGQEVTTQIDIQVPLDVILVLDASSSMQEFTQSADTYVAVTPADGKWDQSVQSYPEGTTADTNLWDVFAQSNQYYVYENNAWNFKQMGVIKGSILIPVQPGDHIYCSSFRARAETGGSKNGMRVTYFDANGEALENNWGYEAVYESFTGNNSEYIVVPEGAAAMNIPVWAGESEHVIKNLSIGESRLNPDNELEFAAMRSKILQQQIEQFAQLIAQNAQEKGQTHKLAVVTYGGGDGEAGIYYHGYYDKHVGINGYNDFFTNTGLFVNGQFKNYVSAAMVSDTGKDFYTPVFADALDESKTYYYLYWDNERKGGIDSVNYSDGKWSDSNGNVLIPRSDAFDSNDTVLFMSKKSVAPTTLTDADYKNALTDVLGTDGNLNSAVKYATDHYVARGTTFTAYGLLMAKKILEQNNARTYVDASNKEYVGKQIVILFTDGDTNSIISKIFEYANEIKNKNATIYTIGMSQAANNLWMDQISSNCAAGSYDKNAAMTGGKYYIHIEDMAQLGDIFESIQSELTSSTTTVTLDEKAVMKEVLSDYVQLDADAEIKWKVYTQDYLGNDTWGELVEFTDAEVTTTTAAGRVENIEVSGFDYADNYVTEVARTDLNDSTNTNFHGRKLVLKVYIESRDGFWGGNNVPTNKSTTAIYSDGELVQPFPMPEVNVPITVTVEAVDKTIYYNGTIDTDGDGKEGDDLIAKVTIGGKEVTVENDGTFTPKEDWMDDFANASWDEDFTTPSSDLSNVAPDDYTYTVVVTPTSDGTTNKSENPSNIAGNVDGGEIRDKDLSESVKRASGIGHVYILVPELTFKDSTTEFGTSADGYDYTGKDYVKTEWVFMEDTADTKKAPDVSGDKPELTLTYTPDTTGDHSLKDGSFVTDTKVNVTVSIGGDDITAVAEFKWQDDCTYDNHTDDMDITSHNGKAESNEFWIHVTLEIVPDIVVIDYGLDVVIDILANDPQTATVKPTLTGIGAKDATSFSENPVSGTYGKLSVETDTDTSKVRYSLNTSNGMQMKEEETFAYAVKYTGPGTDGYYYSTVTVIPATTIYYEDNFVSYTVWNVSDDKPNTDTANQWKSDGTALSADQAQDRPGTDWADALDADNIYGYDGAYTGMTTYSMGSAMKFTANSQVYGEAQFTFWGTGFDVISLTSGTTGTITVDVYKTSDFKLSTGDNYGAEAVKSHMVDTYYGYKYEDGQWVVDTEATDSLYQVPVMKVSGLAYGQYTAVITVYYKTALDHQNHNYYDFYLDAIRIYDPANDGASSETIKNAYVADGEGWPEYFELRNLIISKNDFDALKDGEQTTGVIFIDDSNDTNSYSISDYTNYGPNNELYLAPNQSVAFDLAILDDVAGIHLAMKTVGNGSAGVGDSAAVMVYDAKDTSMKSIVPATISTATDLYYDITSLNNKTVVIANTSETDGAILSITNVKVTYQREHTDSIESGYFTVSQEDAGVAIASLMMMRPSVEPEVPEETVPETTVPEETVPETTVPEETVPETTVPEETTPETTVPEEEDPAVFEPEKFSVRLSNSSVKVGSKVTVTVTTGTDVEYITINGTKVTKYSGSRFGGTRTWQVRVEAEKAGEQAVTVVCYNRDDLASLPVTETFTVTEQYTNIMNVVTNLITGFFDRLWGSR